MKNTGVENAGLENVGPNRRVEKTGLENTGPNRTGGKSRNGKHGTKAHLWNSRDWKTQDQISRVENARPPSIEREMDKYKLERNTICILYYKYNIIRHYSVVQSAEMQYMANVKG